jgi:hypothetical protein
MALIERVSDVQLIREFLRFTVAAQSAQLVATDLMKEIKRRADLEEKTSEQWVIDLW